MCIGIPMQVCSPEPGHAWCEGLGERRRVNTALVGEVVPGEWLLVFLDGARERITAERAAEVQAALALLEGALMSGLHGVPPSPDLWAADPGFALPSAMSADQVAALAGQAPHHLLGHPLAQGTPKGSNHE